MPIPNADLAFIPGDKLAGYLLDEQHPVGGSKARWFRSVGYEIDVPAVLEQDLLKLVQTSDDFQEKASAFGIKYIVRGKISTPSGNDANVTTVWIVEPTDNRPRLVTAFPGDKP